MTTTPHRAASLVGSLAVLAALSLLALSFQARLAVERSDPNVAAPGAPAALAGIARR